MTTKQRAYLKSLAMTMDPIFQIGKSSLTPENTKAIAEALEARELIKGTVLQNSPMTARDAIAALCEGTNAEPVQCIGNRFVIYRAREKDPKIVLP